MAPATYNPAATVVRLKRALAERNRDATNDAVSELMVHHAPLGAQWRLLAQVMLRNGECTAAVEAIGRYVASQRNSGPSRMEQVAILHRIGRIAEARTILAAISMDSGQPGMVAYLRGTLDTLLGHRDGAREALLLATKQGPQFGHYWLALAMTANMAAESVLADRIVAADFDHRAGRINDPDAYCYALGKVHADRADHDAAFTAIAEGAAMVANRSRFDPATNRSNALTLTQEYTPALIDSVARAITVPTRRAIIVTGNPRSGTTLVEQIITSHTAVADGDELGLMRIISQEMGAPTAAHLNAYCREHRPDRLAQLYLHLLDERFGSDGRIVDKTLIASRVLGLMAAILPEAPLIWMRRNSLDCAWSCFRTYFVDGHPWSWSLADIAQHFRTEERLLSHWQSVLGRRLLVVDYEALVRTPESVTRTILDHCGLAPEPGVFTPEKTNRAVRTASTVQVRQPISSRAIGAAEPYRRHLMPFIDAYDKDV